MIVLTIHDDYEGPQWIGMFTDFSKLQKAVEQAYIAKRVVWNIEKHEGTVYTQYPSAWLENTMVSGSCASFSWYEIEMNTIVGIGSGLVW